MSLPRLLVLLTLFVMAQPAWAGDPKLTFNPKETLPMRLKGEVFEHEFTVSNTGDGELQIKRITSKCPCARILDFPKTLAPGESGSVKMRIDAGKIAIALNEKTINIFTNAFPARQIYYFYIEVRKPYHLGPDEPVIAGLFTQPKIATLEVKRATREFQIVSATSKQGKFKVAGVDVVDDGKHYRIKLAADKAAAAEKVTDELVLSIKTRDGREFTNEIGMTIDHQSPIVLDPDAPLRFLNKDTDPLLPEGAKPVTRRILIKSVDPATSFTVKSAKIEGKNTEVFSVKVDTVEAGKTYALTVAINDYSKKSYLKGKLIVETEGGGAGRHELEVMAIFGKRRK